MKARSPDQVQLKSEGDSMLHILQLSPPSCRGSLYLLHGGITSERCSLLEHLLSYKVVTGESPLLLVSAHLTLSRTEYRHTQLCLCTGVTQTPAPQ